MKLLGMIGGIGPESTIDYYRILLERFRQQTGGDANLPLLINSIDLHRVLEHVARGEYQRLTDYLVREVNRLADAGAHLGFIAANTPHIVFDTIQPRCRIPLMSIVVATLNAALALGLTRLGILGTRFTMEADVYVAPFRSAGMEIIPPSTAERSLVHSLYTENLLRGQFDVDTRRSILQVIDQMLVRDRIDSVILAGTELPLLLRDSPKADIPFLDTTLIHAEAVLRTLLAEEPDHQRRGDSEQESPV